MCWLVPCATWTIVWFLHVVSNKKMRKTRGGSRVVFRFISRVMACTKPPLSFADLVKGRDASVRVIEDGAADVVDLVMVATGKDCNQSNELLRDLKPSLFDKEKIFTIEKRRYVTLKDAISLIMVLPGKMAKELRSQFADIIEKYIRENLGLSPAAEEPMLTGFKRRREELELSKLEEEIKGMVQTRILAATAEMERVRDPIRSNLDDRTRLMIQDAMQNSILNTMHSVSTGMGGGQGQGGPMLLTNGTSANAPISISSVAAALKYKPSSSDYKRIGMDLRKRYLKKHGKAPTKHDQLCDGRVTYVNSYTEQDRALVVEVLHSYFKPSDDSSNAGDD